MKTKIKKVPELRFPEFNGEWVEKKISELIKEYTMKNKKKYKPVAIGVYGIRKREDIFSKNLTNNIEPNKVIFKNTLTFGLGTNQIVFGVLLEDICYSVSPAYKTFKILEKNIIPSFLNYLLNLKNKELSSKYMIISSRQGKSVNIKELLNHKLVIPKILEEQEAIAEFLSLIDKKIELNEKKLKALKKYKKGILQKLLNVNEKGIPELRFPEFSGKWVEKRLKNVIIENKKSKHNVNSNVKKGKYKFFTSGNSQYKSNHYLVDGENLFIADGGKFDVKYYNGKADYTNHVYSIKIEKNYYTLFLFYILSSITKKINKKYFQGSGLKNLDKKGFKNFKIYLPPTLEEQKAIAEFLSLIDKKIELNEKKLEALKKYKKGLLQKMFV